MLAICNLLKSESSTVTLMAARRQSEAGKVNEHPYSYFFNRNIPGESAYQTPGIDDFISGKINPPWSFKIPGIPERITRGKNNHHN